MIKYKMTSYKGVLHFLKPDKENKQHSNILWCGIGFTNNDVHHDNITLINCESCVEKINNENNDYILRIIS